MDFAEPPAQTHPTLGGYIFLLGAPTLSLPRVDQTLEQEMFRLLSPAREDSICRPRQEVVVPPINAIDRYVPNFRKKCRSPALFSVASSEGLGKHLSTENSRERR